MIYSILLSDIVSIAIIILIIAAASIYIIKAKKSGQKCIGCPYSKSCSKNKKNTEDNCCCNKNK